METALHLLPDCPGLTLNSPYFDASQQEVHLHIEINDIGSPCPRCQINSRALHSHYVRQVKDLPWGEWTVHLSITAHKYRCRMPDCPQQVFCQRLPIMVAPWARRTLRLAEGQRQLGLALGGAAGARLAVKQRTSVSRSTLLRLVRSVPCPIFTTPRVLDIDDWAMRKRQRYGTILVDLETRRPVALLADRKATTLHVWLEAHPGVEIVTRDRYKAFADGVSGGAPQAQQVLDRFHLMQNLTGALEKVFGQSRMALETVLVPEGATPLPVAPLLAVHDLSCNPVMPLTAALLVPPGLPTISSKTRRQRRIERYEQIKAWHAQGWTIRVGRSARSLVSLGLIAAASVGRSRPMRFQNSRAEPGNLTLTKRI
ncbi:ISL3 family transposase [Deinococcus detaillensis]|uniref:ISL3 family transposase n=1 Tax=Deinococcus detaillensis TaxID=2592048 RepID=A0A553UF90_9DEIO|nr:ISL3 family transposase [Deinococcus detaillensis]